MLIPTVNNIISITGIIPHTVNTDNCYGSEDNVNTLKNEYNIFTFSINGAKGKKLTIEDWDTTNYRNARNDRSSVESSMFFSLTYKRFRLRNWCVRKQLKFLKIRRPEK